MDRSDQRVHRVNFARKRNADHCGLIGRAGAPLLHQTNTLLYNLCSSTSDGVLLYSLNRMTALGKRPVPVTRLCSHPGARSVLGGEVLGFERCEQGGSGQDTRRR